MHYMRPDHSSSSFLPDDPDGPARAVYEQKIAGLASMIGRQALTPLDLERDFGLIDGDIFHGALSLNQLFSARPMLGHADYRGPLKGLYHCGAGAHPGGGVTGAVGHNAARAVLRDVKGLLRR